MANASWLATTFAAPFNPRWVPGVSQLRGNALLGRAMGRVLAHGLDHIMADTSQHEREAVAQAAFPASELTSGHLLLKRTGIEAMGRVLARAR